MKRAVFLLIFAGLALGLAGPAQARIAFVRGESIYTADDDGSSLKRVTKGSLVEISPDGRWMTFSRFIIKGSRWETWLSRTNGKSMKRISRARDPLGAEFSPDSKLVALGYRNKLSIMEVATRRAAVLATGAIRGFSFAPDGHAIVFERLRTPGDDIYNTDPRDLWIVERDRTGLRQLTTDGVSLNPLWTAQGVVFNRQEVQEEGKAPLYQIFQQNTQTGVVSELTTRPVVANDLISGPVPVARSADGLRLVAAVSGQSQFAAMLIDFSNGSIRDFGTTEIVPLGMSRDGSRVLLQTGSLDPTDRHNLVLADFATMQRRTIIRNAHSASWTG
ncbi:hypothetical protein OJ998_15080 [Solirubrobacter taibaiensis]|nr:hypothetical protein [Solirubrobacter taibaiensis]